MSAKKTSSTPQKTSRFVVHKPVFIPTLIIIVVSVTLALLFHKESEIAFARMQDFVSDKGGWIYTLSVNSFILFCLYLAFSKYGEVRIGGPEAKPEFKGIAWFAMLFSAGIGNGLVLFSIADPVRDFVAPPRLAADADPSLIAQEAINFSFLHHGIHGWAIYSVIGLALAYFTYNRKMPLTIRSAFYPILGDRIYSWIGDAIDVVAVVATLFGLATTLGFGVGQINAGMSHVFGIPTSLLFQYGIILAITGIATISVVSGVNKGVKFLSELNIGIAVVLFLLVLFLGPTSFILKGYIQNIGSYLSNFVDMATWSGNYGENNWHNNVTLMYWGWWASWSPFVGTFIARVSRGRTIKQFVLGVLLLPALVTFLWFSAFGGTTMKGLIGGDYALVDAVKENISTALFVFFEKFPFAIIFKILGMLLICSFIITSADSGALVVDSITSGGQRRTPAIQRVLWASLSGIIAAALLTGGGLDTLQAAVTISGMPFAVLLVIMCISLLIGIREDYNMEQRRTKMKQTESYKASISKIMREEQVAIKETGATQSTAIAENLDANTSIDNTNK
ncbi:BCCT family transporter [Sphingobacterium yanglingense]|uniref:Choline/glycine/proline betaine transport protein n=1 Tax=Sphingobacterium yanglingense TaxID=1437280 RepID=A0A4R6WTF0_9SPHI|nr:BCCT family transporter [Sphingobacterium yanglingense]TDQ80036.1 choline/glycine/proline betaine transport protein [Sphingobacterium yanglingense]